jgi:hypothetical protein
MIEMVFMARPFLFRFEQVDGAGGSGTVYDRTFSVADGLQRKRAMKS